MDRAELIAECSQLEEEIAGLRRQLVDAQRRLSRARERAESVAARSYWTGILVGTGLVALAGVVYAGLGVLAMTHLH